MDFFLRILHSTFFSILVLQVTYVSGQQQNELGEGFFSPNTNEAETLYL